MKKSLFCVLGITAGFALAAQGLVRPTWIEVLPQQPGKVYAVGAASLGDNSSQALKQASQNARLELATRLRASVKGETSIKSQMTVQRELGGLTSASSRQQVAQDSRITTQISELTGLGIAETWTDTGARTVYALACLDVEAAMAALKSRADAVRAVLPRVEGISDPREAAQAALRLRKGRDEATRLEELAAPLIEAGGDPDFRSQIQKLLAELGLRADGLRAALTIGVEGASALQPELLAVLRSSAQQQGFGWLDGRGLLSIRVQVASVKGGLPRQWWTVDDSSDFITHKGTLQLSLVDRASSPRGTATLEVSGVGTSQAGASQGLMKDVRKKFDGVLDRWLSDLAL